MSGTVEIDPSNHEEQYKGSENSEEEDDISATPAMSSRSATRNVPNQAAHSCKKDMYSSDLAVLERHMQLNTVQRSINHTLSKKKMPASFPRPNPIPKREKKIRSQCTPNPSLLT